MTTVGIYKTRHDAEAAVMRWADIFAEDLIQIVFCGTYYLVLVPAE